MMIIIIITFIQSDDNIIWMSSEAYLKPEARFSWGA